jgi:uracil-DNA glycosylase
MDSQQFDDGLDNLRREIGGCRICRDTPLRGFEQRLPHQPRPVAVISARAKILIAGQAPGLRVHDSGLPFNDASGDRLRQWLNVDRAAFYDRDRFAILPMGFCFPGYDARGSDLPPRRECAPVWRMRTLQAMPQIELVLAIGGYAQAYHLGQQRRGSVTETVANWRQYLFANSGTPVLPLPHPSWRNSGWLKKNAWFEAELLPALRAVVDRVSI